MLKEEKFQSYQKLISFCVDFFQNENRILGRLWNKWYTGASQFRNRNILKKYIYYHIAF